MNSGGVHPNLTTVRRALEAASFGSSRPLATFLCVNVTSRQPVTRDL